MSGGGTSSFFHFTSLHLICTHGINWIQRRWGSGPTRSIGRALFWHRRKWPRRHIDTAFFFRSTWPGWLSGFLAWLGNWVLGTRVYILACGRCRGHTPEHKNLDMIGYLLGHVVNRLSVRPRAVQRWTRVPRTRPCGFCGLVRHTWSWGESPTPPSSSGSSNACHDVTLTTRSSCQHQVVVCPDMSGMIWHKNT